MYENSDFTVLIVDDESDVRHNASFYFNAKGFNSISIESCVEALELIKSRKVDICIIDFFMPEMTGEELIQKIRKDYKELVIILQTAHSGEKPPLEMLETLDIQSYHDKSDGIEVLYEKLIAAKKVSAQIHRIKELYEQNIKLDEDLKETKRLVEALKKDKEVLIEREHLANIGAVTKKIADSIAWPCSYLRYDIDNIAEKFRKTYDDIISEKGLDLHLYHLIKSQTLEELELAELRVGQLEDISRAMLDQENRMEIKIKDRFNVHNIINNYKDFINEGFHRYSVGIEINYEKLQDPITTRVYIEGDPSNMFFILIKLYEGIAKSCSINYKETKSNDIKDNIFLDYNIQDKNVQIILEYDGKIEPNLNMWENSMIEEHLTHGKRKSIYFELAMFTIKELINQYEGTVEAIKEDRKVRVVLTLPILVTVSK